MSTMGALYKLMKNGDEYLFPVNCRAHLVHNTDNSTTEKISFDH